MIGNLADATLAVSGNAEWLGAGAYRGAFLINGVVYKVCLENDVPGTQANLDEWEFYPIACDIVPEGCAVPETMLYAVGPCPVIAMAYVEGTPMGECYCTPDEPHSNCLPLHIETALSTAGFFDIG